MMRALSTAACAFIGSVACGDAPPDFPDATLTDLADSSTPSDARRAEARAEDEGEIDAPADAPPDATREAPAAACPDDMISVRTSFCPDVVRRCLDAEHDSINNLDICHAFSHEQRCRAREREIAFCIDRYEYPNQRGAHPTWMRDWYQAQATCESKGKRLCYASEWTAACEGPDHSPFPYGFERDHRKCNMDNFFIEPRKWGPRGQFLFYSKDETIAGRELARLDESVPSGSIDTCKSGFGVYDMPGNLDEWVISDEAPRERSKWAGLKGGAWGHVRSQCRPMTFSHDPGFTYYFVGFRCCRDAQGAPAWTPSPHALPPPEVEPHDFAPDPIVVTDAPGPTKTKFSRTGRPE
jgi:sulfatase-modifying factor enzyme 1